MRRNIAIAAGGAALIVSLAGCMGDTGGKGSTDGGGGNGGGVALSAAQVMNKAAQNTKSADTYRLKMSINMSTKQSGKTQQMHMAGTGQYQLKPSLAFAMNMGTMDMGGQKMPGGMQMRLVDNNMYMKMSMLTKLTGGKPWVKISLAEAGKKSGMNLKKLLDSAQQQANPASMTQMFTASKDVKKVGSEDIGGTPTTHYTGTVDMTKALSKIDAKYRKAAATQMKQLKNVKFDLWADAQQLPRKVVLNGSANGGSYKATELFSDFGEPVHVAAPPAGQTTDASQLGKQMGQPN